jgi:hypothetical protein
MGASNNPLAAHYSEDQGYPAWTDRVQWDHVIDMSSYGSADQSEFEKFEAARDEVHALGGGILFYPAGTYDFSDGPMDGPNGRGLMLKSGVVIRGEAPSGDSDASDGTLTLRTRFEFCFTSRDGTGVTPFGETPRDWNLIGLQPDAASGETLSEVENVGIVHIHLIGASVFWGFELDWDGATGYATSGAWKSGVVKSGWADRVANGQFPLHYFAGSSGSRSYVGAGSGRASGKPYYLTMDGYVQVKPGGPGDISDTLSRAFDLSGGPLWVHGNKYGGIYGSTDSIGNDGEGILCQAHGGTELFSWAVTYNDGQSGYMSGYDVDQFGSLWGWNTTVGRTGSTKAGQMYDSAIVGNSGGSTGTTGSIVPLTSSPGDPITSNPGDPIVGPLGVVATPADDYVEVSWVDGDENETGFRVERSVDEGPWTTIAYRPHSGTGWQTETASWEGDSGRTAADGTPLYEYRFEMNDQSFLCRVQFDFF